MRGGELIKNEEERRREWKDDKGRGSINKRGSERECRKVQVGRVVVLKV